MRLAAVSSASAARCRWLAQGSAPDCLEAPSCQPRFEDPQQQRARRPVNLHAYSQTSPSLPRLAATYGFALARGHCFPDGNKRVALAIIDVFLHMNCLELTADEIDAVDTVQSLAAGDVTEDQLADWITIHVASIAKTQSAPQARESP